MGDVAHRQQIEMAMKVYIIAWHTRELMIWSFLSYWRHILKIFFFTKINIPVNEVQFKSIKGKTPRFLYWSSSVHTQRWFIHHSEVPGHLAQFFNVINWGTLCCLQCEITILWLCIETWTRKGAGGSKLIDWPFQFCYDLEI